MKFPGTTIHHLSSLISICLKRSPFWSDKPTKCQAYNVLLIIKLQLHNDSRLYSDLSGYNMVTNTNRILSDNGQILVSSTSCHFGKL